MEDAKITDTCSLPREADIPRRRDFGSAREACCNRARNRALWNPKGAVADNLEIGAGFTEVVTVESGPEE